MGMEGKNNLALAIAVFLIGFFAGFLFKTYFPEDALMGVFFSDGDSEDEWGNTLLFEAGDFGRANYLSIENQHAGPGVLLKEVGLADGGWVVVHEGDGGAPGKILGARRLDAGKYEAISVELLRETLPGGTYYAMLHGDDGDKEFDFNKDFPIRNDLGEVIMSDFETLF